MEDQVIQAPEMENAPVIPETPAPAQIISPERYQELFKKGWKFLTTEERAEYKTLKDALGIKTTRTRKLAQVKRVETIAQVNGLPLRPTDDEGLPRLSFEDKKAVLFNCFGLMADSDDKGRFNQLITDDAFIREATQDQIYTRAIWLVQDGNSRAVVR